MPYNYGNYYTNMPMNGTGYSTGGSTGGMSYAPNYVYNQQPQMMDGYQRSVYQQSQPQIQNQSIIWVQGEAGAKAYPVAAGQSVLLMDSEDAVLYVKSTDHTGRPLPMESYDLVKRESVVNVSQASHAQQDNSFQSADMSEYVKISDLEKTVNDMVSKAVSKALGD